MNLMLLIYVPDAVDPELCAVVDDCHSGGLLLIYVPDAVDPELCPIIDDCHQGFGSTLI
jgi:hypothetical protein